MIVAPEYQLVFLHAPKAAGTSIREALEQFHDKNVVTWGLGEHPRGYSVDLAHMGLDEIAEIYGETWDIMRSGYVFTTIRDPALRFFSSVAEYSKHYSDQDIRYLPESSRPAYIRKICKMLSEHGTATAESLLADYRLTHFRAQLIYIESRREDAPQVHVWPVRYISGLSKVLSEKTGKPIVFKRSKVRESYALPAPLAALLSRGTLRNTLRRVPGRHVIKTLGLRYFSVPSSTGTSPDDLSAEERDFFLDFIENFYECDYNFMKARGIIAS